MMENGENLDDNELSPRKRYLINRERIKRFARITKRRLILLIVFLVVIVLALTFRIGEALWPAWLMEARVLIRGILLFFIIFLLPLSPVIIEADSNPRALDGPGRRPGMR